MLFVDDLILSQLDVTYYVSGFDPSPQDHARYGLGSASRYAGGKHQWWSAAAPIACFGTSEQPPHPLLGRAHVRSGLDGFAGTGVHSPAPLAKSEMPSSTRRTLFHDLERLGHRIVLVIYCDTCY